MRCGVEVWEKVLPSMIEARKSKSKLLDGTLLRR